MNLLPIMIRSGNNKLSFKTTYFDTEMCAKGLYYLVHNNGKYFLFFTKWNEKVLKEMETGISIVITRCNFKGKEDSFEIMFDDNSDNPYMNILKDERFTCITKLKEGWNRTFYVYSDDKGKK